MRIVWGGGTPCDMYGVRLATCWSNLSEASQVSQSHLNRYVDTVLPPTGIFQMEERTRAELGSATAAAAVAAVVLAAFFAVLF